MGKVRFRLQSVLAHRRRAEERLQMELAALSSEYLREEQALPVMQHSLGRQMKALARLQAAQVLDLVAIELGLAALGRTQSGIERQQALLKELSEKMEEKREELIQAMKNRKVLERLKEKQRARALAEERRADATAGDEIARTQYHWTHYIGPSAGGAG
jgi:flagellar FliJ protein